MSSAWLGGSTGFRLLGPVRLAVPGRSVDLGPGKQKCLAAALLLAAGRSVPVDDLIDRLWGSRPPSGARNVLATYVTRLRQVLGRAGAGSVAAFRFADGGYRLDCDPDTVDVHRSRSLARQARAAAAADDDLRAADGLRAALRGWQPVALAGVPGEWAAGIRAGLGRERLSLVVSLAQAELRLGRPAQVVDELSELVDEHPANEELTAELIRALVGCGQSVAALRCYERLRRAVADELGTEPSAQLRGLHLHILRGQADPDGPAAMSPAEPTAGLGGPPPARIIPAQLPADVSGFVGRAEHLARLDALLTGAEQPTTVVISAVSGTAGVGKTALAVHWAHRVAERFPDGQLYVNLRGFDQGPQVMESAAAVRGFLEALGVAAERVPADPDAQAGLYRSLLAGRRVLVLVDNARDAGHARPLLPGTATAVAVVTSRDLLTDLVAADGAHPLPLDLLSTVEARELLARRLGPSRVAAEPDAVDQIITVCARLPLALALVAARAATHPAFPLTAVAGELTGAASQAFPPGDTDPVIARVRAVFSWSYTTLTPAAARLFRLLGLHSSPDISAPAAASLAALPPSAARPCLGELARVGLLIEQAPGRYAFHDLLAAYAADLARSVDPDNQRRSATLRLLDHHIHTAHAADRLLHPARGPIPLALTPPAAGTTPEHLADQPAALGWLDAERPALLATLRLAARAGFDAHVWQLAWALATFLDRRGHWHDLVGAWQAAVAAAGRLAHRPAAEAYAHRRLARALTMLGGCDQARTHLRSALVRYADAGDAAGQADTHRALSLLWERQDRPDLALDHARRALILSQAAGDRRGLADALNSVGWYRAVLGEHAAALTYCQRALTMHRQTGDRDGEAASSDTLGYAHHHLNHHTRAADCYQHAITLYRGLGDRYNEADTLVRLGDTHHATGHADGAHTAWTGALDILTALDHPDTAAVRARLRDLDRPGSGNRRR